MTHVRDCDNTRVWRKALVRNRHRPPLCDRHRLVFWLVYANSKHFHFCCKDVYKLTNNPRPCTGEAPILLTVLARIAVAKKSRYLIIWRYCILLRVSCWMRFFSRIYSPVYSTAKVLELNAMEHAVVAPLFPRGNFVMATPSCAKTWERSYSGSTGELGSLWSFLSQQDRTSIGLV